MTTTKTFSQFLDEIEQDPSLAESQREMRPSRDLALMLVAIRKRRGLTQSAFAKVAGVSQSYVAQLESGAANPSIRAVDRLLRRLGIEWRLDASVNLSAFDRSIEPLPQASTGPDSLTKEEAVELKRVTEAAIQAFRRARVGSRVPAKELVLREIAASYDAGRGSGDPDSAPAGDR
jgi:transcriptional regulator with XRE-family HTH domain